LPTFTYSAKDRDGRTAAGTIDAESAQEAARALRERGLTPQRIRERSPSRSFTEILERAFLSPPIALQMLFFKQLATMLSAGMSVSEALGKMANRSGLRRLRRPIAEVEGQVAAGGRLSDGLGRYPWIFGGLPLSLMEAGEISGGMDRAAEQAATYLEKDMEIRRKLSWGTFYPKAVLVVALLILKFIPFPITHGPLGFLREHMLSIIALGFLAWLLVRAVFRAPGVARGWDLVKLGVPGIGSVVRKFALAKFARAVAVLYAAGVPIARCVELAAEATGNNAIRDRLATAVGPLRNGVDLHTALSRTGGLTDIVQDMVSTGQITGNLDTMLNKTAEYYEAEAEAGMHKTIVVVSIVVLLIAAALIGYLVIMFYSGLYGQEMSA